jgi:hypothetical protein
MSTDMPPAADDDPDAGPGNCGLGPGGSAELVLELDASSIPEALWPGGIQAMPATVYAGIRDRGFQWIVLTNLPSGTDVGALARIVHDSGLKLIVNGPDGAEFSDARTNPDGGSVIYGDGSVTYEPDPTPLELLRKQSSGDFIKYLQAVTEGRRLSAVRSATDELQFHERSAATASAALLLLPGLRFFRSSDLQMSARLLQILALPAVSKGVFSLPVVRQRQNCVPVVAWKYTRGSEHVLVTVNFTNFHSIADIVCEDAPDNGDDEGLIPVFELLSRTKYSRVPAAMRTAGMAVILYEYEIQVFKY